jgi:hypothetical protein
LINVLTECPLAVTIIAAGVIGSILLIIIVGIVVRL